MKLYTEKELLYLPTQPGVYQFYNQKKEVIYVGKAKDIKKRISSYFNISKQESIKIQRMVQDIDTINYTIVSSEYEALLLENNLIKTLQPRYNILLKDGKSYPYLCITNERFPKVIITRNTSLQLGTYYGPFTSTQSIHQILALIKKLYPLRTCHYKLSLENIQKKKFKVCLDYHIGICKAPCTGLQDEEDYNQNIAQIEKILKHNLYDVKKDIKEKMYQAAQNLFYKEAQRYKEQLMVLNQYQSKSLVVNVALVDVDLDIVGIISDEKAAFISYLQVKQGAISFAKTMVIKKKLNEKDEELLPLVTCNLRETYHSHAKEVLTNLALCVDLDIFKFSVPKIGDKKKLVALAVQNAFLCKKAFYIMQDHYQQKSNTLLYQLQQDLQLKELPLSIECFDNSHLQGSHPVSSMIHFQDGKPNKSRYRHFYIKTATGSDDFAMMHEVILRRYHRLVIEETPLPNLIVVDGGKGQLNSAVQAMKEAGIYGKVPIIGLAKKLEKIFYPKDPYPLYISKQSPSLKLLQKIRNEAHRFAISFHRNVRSKKSLQSQLKNIPTLGPKTLEKLLKKFGSLQHIQAASLQTLTEHIGLKKAHATKTYLDFPPQE